MPILKTEEEIRFLRRVDNALRDCKRQEDIATDEGIPSAGGLQSRLKALGFKTDRTGGWHLVDVLMGRDLAEWLASGELAAAPAEALEVAA